MNRTPAPCIIVIFGASGDLTARKLMPALYNLTIGKRLPNRTVVVGFARSEMTSEQYRARMREAVAEHSRSGAPDDEGWDRFAADLHYICARDHDVAAYERLKSELDRLNDELGCENNRLYYLATPPSAYTEIIDLLGQAGLAQRPQGWTRIVIEKPFGRDEASARGLNERLHRHFDERQIFRIDHYLGKETVQNLFVFRFSNGIFEPVWNRRYVDHVQITVAESIGVEHRGAYYEEAGTIRDILQNHLLQLLTLTAMEPPVEFGADAIRDEKAKVLHALEHGGPSGCVRGQYRRGRMGSEEVPGYREEPDVAPDSKVDTFVAVRCLVDNWRWAGVPFYLRTGKRMPKRVTEIVLGFKPAPFLPFSRTAIEEIRANQLVVRVQPNEGISICLNAKVPEPGDMRVRTVTMDFDYSEEFVEEAPDAYERLLLDALVGDATLFPRADEITKQWEFVQGLLEAGDEPKAYPAGTWGPPEADELIAPSRWREP
jgi:glucose-6-phosphate 1-dehydrogenase